MGSGGFRVFFGGDTAEATVVVKVEADATDVEAITVVAAGVSPPTEPMIFPEAASNGVDPLGKLSPWANPSPEIVCNQIFLKICSIHKDSKDLRLGQELWVYFVK